MPSSKKAPSSSRMKVTSSARARISSRKIRKDTYKNLNESYIQSATQPQVITMTSISNVDPDPTRTDSSNAILSMLTKLSDSNRALLNRLEKVEQRQSAVSFCHKMPPCLMVLRGLHTFRRIPRHITALQK